MQNELLQQGLALMLAGMGTVFVFLTVLVLAMAALGAAVRRWFPPAPTEAADGVSSEEIAAAAAAVRAHRKRTGSRP